MQSHLDIESDEAVELAAALTALTGESVTDAVVRALRERLSQVQDAPAPRRPLTEEEAQQMIADVMALSADLRAHLHSPASSDHSWLYGDDGLPG